MLNFYDFEVWPKLWCVTIINPITKEETVIVNDSDELIYHYYKHKHEIYVGFNNRQYDDWIFKAILCGFQPWEMNTWLIEKDRKGFEFSELLQRKTLNSFDCMVGFNGLKTLEAFSGMSIEETKIPFDYDGEFTDEMIAEVLKYNRHDVLATIRVFMARKSEFDSYMGLMKLFNLPLSYMSKSKAQLSAIILGAKRTKHTDEFQISMPPTMRIKKYAKVVKFFQHEWNYDTDFQTDIAGVPHVYGTGGIHGAIPNYFGKGAFLHVDVNSYYPSLMLRYPDYCMSRTGASVKKFEEIRDNRILFKKKGDPKADALKIVLNSTYGAMKDRFNPLYDPRSANNVCIFGQLLLTDLIEHLEGHCQLIQSNTDGLIIKIDGNRDEVVAICKEWEARTGMGLGYEVVDAIWQKDVNNYIFHFANVPENGRKKNTYESKGAYVKKLNDLDYDLAIVNEAVKDYLTLNIPVENTIYQCNELRKFQKVVKLSNKYKWVEHEREGRTVKYDNKAYRVYSTRDYNYGRLLKCKDTDKGSKRDKFGNTPDHCRIINEDITNMVCPNWLDREYYIKIAKERLKAFGVNDC